MNEIMIGRMAWPDVRTALDKGYDTAIIACGAVEQHGPHLPLFLDSEHGTELVKGIAHGLGNALVAPTIRILGNPLGMSEVIDLQCIKAYVGKAAAYLQ